MRKLIILLSIILVASNVDAKDRTGAIKQGMTMLYPAFTMDSNDTISTSETVTYTITNLQKYAQNQVFSVALVNISGSSAVTITAYGRVTSTSAWVQIGTPISWTSASNNGDITSTSPINYNYLKVTFVASGATQRARISVFQVKTSNAYDIPANSGTLTISRATSGAVTVTSKDDDANAATTYRAGGTGALTIGAATGTTAITSSDWSIDATGIAANMGTYNDQTISSSASFTGTLAATGATTVTGGLNLPSEPSIYWAAGGAVVSATSGTDVACSNGARWWVEVNIPYNCTITGLAYLIGSVGGTDSVVVQLCNSAGVQVATSRSVGGAAVLVGTTATFQSVPFTAPYAATSGRYYAVVQFNGTTAKFRTYPIVGSKFIGNTSAGTWGTKADITPGTSFVADKAPIIQTY